MRQREIWFANLDPTKGKEQKGKRPVVVLSGNVMNDHFDVCIVCPLTSSLKNFTGCLILKKDKLNNLKSDSEIITFQIRTIDKQRFIQKIGEISEQQLYEIKKGLLEILTY